MAWLTGKCIDCGKDISPKSTRCRTCSNHSRILDIPRWERVGRKEYQRIYLKTIYRDKKRILNRKYQQDLKKEIFQLLGSKCLICGYSGLALQVDHVNNNGNEERERFGNGGSNRYQKNILDKIQSGSRDYQLLCANCNWEKELLRRRYIP